MKKIIVLQEAIPQYRIPVFERLAEKYDLTVAYTKKKYAPGEVKFRAIYLPETKVGPFVWLRGLRTLCKEYDVVIYMPDLHFVSFCLIPILPHKYKTISFGMGFRASYKRRYNLNKRKDIIDRILGYLTFKGDAVLLYFKEVLKFWKPKEKVIKKCFETRNTVEVVPYDDNNAIKDTILFVGTLYKEKKVDVLIKAYNQVVEKSTNSSLPSLKIIGGGAMLEELKQMADSYGLKDKIIFTGPVYDEKEIARHHSTALVCVSPDQAGLSVPHSMGYGVPFITTEGAITGGEILHITNGDNGVLIKNLNELTGVLADVCSNPDKYIKMGANARKYYQSKATLDVMVKGFDDAIQYVLKK